MQPVLLLLVTAAGAQAPEPPQAPAPGPEAPAEVPVRPLFGEVLTSAKRLYFDGRHDDALAMFEGLAERLDEDPTPPVHLATEALLYMGEVQYQLGDTAAAWRTFERAVRLDPQVEMSPFNHPREVVHWFELVKQRVAQQLVEPDPPLPPPPTPPLPVWGYAPLGVPQLAGGHTARGVMYGGLQLAFAAVSIGSFVYLDSVNRAEHPPDWSDDDVVRRVNQVRWGVQWPATIAFWGTWVISYVDARRGWVREHELSVSVGVAGPDGGPSLLLHARF